MHIIIMCHVLFLAAWNISIQSKPGTPSVLQDRDGQIEILRVYALQFVWYCNIMITVFQYVRFSVILVVMALNISTSW